MKTLLTSAMWHKKVMESVEDWSKYASIQELIEDMRTTFSYCFEPVELSEEAKKSHADFLEKFLKAIHEGSDLSLLTCSSANPEDTDNKEEEEEERSDEEISLLEEEVKLHTDAKIRAEKILINSIEEEAPDYKKIINGDYASMLFVLFFFLNKRKTVAKRKEFQFFLSIPPLEGLTVGITDTEIQEYMNGDHTKIPVNKVIKAVNRPTRAQFFADMFFARCIVIKTLNDLGATDEQIERLWYCF